MSNDLKFSQVFESISHQIDLVQNKPKSGRIIDISKFRSLIKKEFNPSMEHDSHEFLLYFLNKLKDELTENGSKLPSNIQLNA